MYRFRKSFSLLKPLELQCTDHKDIKYDEDASFDSLHGLPERVSPAVEFYLSLNKGLGRWGPSNPVEEISPTNMRGHLEQHMEKFSADNGCDIEHYIIAPSELSV